MKIINSYIYKTFIIWKFEDGSYMVDDTNGKTFTTLKAAKQYIDILQG